MSNSSARYLKKQKARGLDRVAVYIPAKDKALLKDLADLLVRNYLVERSEQSREVNGVQSMRRM